MKMNFNLGTHQLTFIDKGVLLKDEFVSEVCEYAEQKLAVACWKNENLL